VISLRRYLLVLLSFSFGACATNLTEQRKKKTALYDPKPLHVQTGIASWYRDHRTASGERFSINALAAAHRSLPFGSKVRVIDLKTGNSIIVRINDRGPYIRGRIIDLTIGAARQLGTYHRGIARVRIEVLREIPILEKPNLRTVASTAKRKIPAANPFAFLFADSMRRSP
jgi:rare lipoprotein A